MDCRSCSAELTYCVIDLGEMPLANAYLRASDLTHAEPCYPLQVWLCEQCWLMQIPAVTSSDDIFSEYAYFSSFSDSWLQHAKDYVHHITQRLTLNEQHFVVELASNDGYLLKNFVANNIPCLGVEPAANVAQQAQCAGIDTLVKFFGAQVALELRQAYRAADLIIANNVLAHVPDLNDFVAGMKRLLSDSGTITIEFPHLVNLLAQNQFDTIYHEHFSYFSLTSARSVMQRHGLRIYDVQRLATHGGSLRLYVTHEANTQLPSCDAVNDMLAGESSLGLRDVSGYADFSRRVAALKVELLSLLREINQAGQSIAAYGAPAKGNTLLNYCGLSVADIAFTVDRSPHKQGHFLPGSHIPIYDVAHIAQHRPDYLIILPWNLSDEIMSQLSRQSDWRGQCLRAIPKVEYLPWT